MSEPRKWTTESPSVTADGTLSSSTLSLLKSYASLSVLP
jgi:hypothetical protein